MQMASMTLDWRTVEYDQVSTWHFKPDSETPFEAGMFIHLVAPGGPVGKDSVRHMSFASAPKEGVFSFAMDVASGTPFKKAMDAMQPGEACQFFKIKFKHFAPLWSADQKEVVFIAGGIGITPIRSLIKQHGDTIDWQVIHVARDNKHLYAAELAALGAPHVCTNHSGAAAAVSAALAAKPAAWYYVCGSERFMQGMLAQLSAGGVQEERIKAESFN